MKFRVKEIHHFGDTGRTMPYEHEVEADSQAEVPAAVDKFYQLPITLMQLSDNVTMRIEVVDIVPLGDDILNADYLQ
jgi:hypothetical protein